MTGFATIGIIGIGQADILLEIARLRAWSGKHDFPVIVVAGKKEVYDNIENLECGVKTDLVKYVTEKFPDKKLLIKTGGNNDVYMVPSVDAEGKKQQKIRNKMLHLKPKKKKRK